MQVESHGHPHAVGAQGRLLWGSRRPRSRQGGLLYGGGLLIIVVAVSKRALVKDLSGDKRIFIRDTFSELDAGSRLFVTHILRGVERGCDAWVRMERGKQ